MNRSIPFYNLLSGIAALIFLVLIILQITWLRKIIDFKKEEINYELKVLAPEIALAINGLDHDAFHVDKEEMNRVSEDSITKIITNHLKASDLPHTIVYSIYQDSTYKIYRTNGMSHRQELIASPARACMSCIVSFSTIDKEDAYLLDEEVISPELFRKKETFQYYSPISSGSESRNELWFSLYHPNIGISAIQSLLFLFVANILLLILLLGLFFLLLRSLANHKKVTKIKDDFFNTVTNEFKTPLSSIRLASKVLRSETPPDIRENYINLIKSESQNLETQIDRLLEISLVDNEEIKLNKNTIPICGLLYEIPSKLMPLIDDKKAQLNIDCQMTDYTITGDYYHLLNAFQNLVENSLKYSSQGVSIDITARLQDERLIIDFSDNGPGISQQHQPHVFERFYRGQTNNQYRGAGFGIGLSYVKSIIATHGGSITLKQSDHRGTTFSIKL